MVRKLLAGAAIALMLAAVYMAVGIRKDFFINKKIAGYFVEKGNYYYNGGEFDIKKAQDYYRRALAVDRKIPWAHYQLARTHLVFREFSLGLSEIDRELEAHPENKRAYYVRGLLDNYSGRHEEAISDFETFIEFSPEEWAGYVDLSWSYMNSQKYPEAIDTASQGLRKFSDNVWLYSNRGLAYYKTGEYEKAESDLVFARNLAEKLTPDDWRRAYPGNDPGKAEEGVREIQAAVSYNLSLVYMKLEKSADFKEEYERYSELLKN